MNHRRLSIAATIIGLIVIIGFMFSIPHTRDVTKPSMFSPTPGIPPVTLRDVFKKGMHTITGSLSVPNACTTVSAVATLQDSASSTGSILIAISMPSNSGVCLQLLTPLQFQTTLAAPAHLPFIVTVNGVTATTSVL